MRELDGLQLDAKHRRRMRKLSREFDRMDRGRLPRQPGRARSPGARRVSREGLIALAVTVVVLAAVAVADPGLTPVSFRSLLPARSAGSGSYRFLDLQTGTHDMPVTYSSCQPLHYAVDFAGAPKQDPKASFVFSAVHRISQASGLKFVYDGSTTQRPQWNSSRTGGPILITFATPAEVPELAGHVAGLGGSVTIRSVGDFREYATGEVSLDEGDIAGMLSRPGGEAEAKAVTLHELGHVLGLAHVKDRSQIMYPTTGRTLDLGAGDLKGLKILGSGPCY